MYFFTQEFVNYLRDSFNAFIERYFICEYPHDEEL
jgi:hypothetical protein